MNPDPETLEHFRHLFGFHGTKQSPLPAIAAPSDDQIASFFEKAGVEQKRTPDQIRAVIVSKIVDVLRRAFSVNEENMFEENMLSKRDALFRKLQALVMSGDPASEGQIKLLSCQLETLDASSPRWTITADMISKALMSMEEYLI